MLQLPSFLMERAAQRAKIFSKYCTFYTCICATLYMHFYKTSKIWKNVATLFSRMSTGSTFFCLPMPLAPKLKTQLENWPDRIIGLWKICSQLFLLAFLVNCDDSKKYAGRCKSWANHGECTKSQKFMKKYCKKSCDLCTGKIHLLFFC